MNDVDEIVQEFLVEGCAGAEGLALVAGEQPDLVLSDRSMPNVNGSEFLRALRERGLDVRSGVTSGSTDAVRETAREAGALSLIAEPLTADTLAASLRGVPAA